MFKRANDLRFVIVWTRLLGAGYANRLPVSHYDIFDDGCQVRLFR